VGTDDQIRRRRWWEAVETVLGLSVTSNSVGWVLLDGPGVDATTLDHDVFDVSVGPVDDGDISKHLTAVQGVQAIAAASGHELRSIGLTWTADAAATANLLLTSLPELGFEKVVSVRLSEAARTWAYVFGGALGFEKAAVCVVEPSAATLLSFGYGAVRTFATHTRESDDGLSRWLNDSFQTNHLDPEHLFLIGSRGDVELISDRLSDALAMSVVTSNEAQLILARGAALTARSTTETVAVVLSDQEPGDLKLTVAAALGQKLAWFSPPVRAGVALLAGVVALFVLGPALVSQPEFPSTNQSTSNSSETSSSIQAVPVPAAPPAKNFVKRIVAPTPLPPSTPPPPVAAEPLAVPETPAAPVVAAPVADVPEAPVAEVAEAPGVEAPVVEVPAEVAPLPAVAGVPHLPAQTVDMPAQTSHLPAETALPAQTEHLPDPGTLHLPGAAPVLAAEAPVATTPTQAASSPVWVALP
jgi:hypothetical protein